MAKLVYRVAQWGTGNVGLRAMRAIIEHPLMELAAVRVYSADKAGVDAGTLCGIAPTGIVATRDIADVIAARPDCVIYLPDQVVIADICTLLAAGINIATGCVGFNHRGSFAPADRAALEAACLKGGTSLYATGSAPGWSTEIVPFALLMMQRRLDSLIITDFADNSLRNSPLMLFDLLGFGADPASLAGRTAGTATSTPPTFRALAEAIGMPLDEVRTHTDYAVARKREVIAAGTIEAGTMGAIRMAVTGYHDGRLLLQRHSIWYVTRDIEPQWELRDSGWRMQVKGDTSLDVSIAFDVDFADYASYSPGLTAHPIVNAVIATCDAAPGLLETADLPMLVPYLGKELRR